MAQAGVYRRGKCSGNMTVCVPHEQYRTPRLRQAARTLAASGRQRGGQDTADLTLATKRQDTREAVRAGNKQK